MERTHTPTSLTEKEEAFVPLVEELCDRGYVCTFLTLNKNDYADCINTYLIYGLFVRAYRYDTKPEFNSYLRKRMR